MHFGHAAVPAAVFRCSALLRLHRPGPWRIHPGCAWGGGNSMRVGGTLDVCGVVKGEPQ